MGAEPSFGLPQEWVKWVKWAKWKRFYVEMLRLKDAQKDWNEIRPPGPWGPDSLTLIQGMFAEHMGDSDL